VWVCQVTYLQRNDAPRLKSSGVAAEQDLRRIGQRYKKARAAVEAARAELEPAIVAARREGLTLDAIARLAGVSRQRVLQILEK
jgi:DNA-directed RNA polymerase sigma subunit (sigma70/sigma32)